MLVSENPRLIVVADPNGSGKTSISEQLLRHDWMDGCVYVNPDFIARDNFGDWNAPDIVLKAARHAEEIREDCLCHGRSLAFETVLSSPEKVAFIARAYLYDNSVDNAKARLLYRVSDGSVVKTYALINPWAEEIARQLNPKNLNKPC